MNDKIWLVIPAYNVDNYLELLLTQAGCFIDPERTVVIDDGSIDNTAGIARRRGVRLIQHEVNRGKGSSLRDGLELVAESGGEWCLTMDGDCQHDPAKIPEFISASASGRFDIIIGNRRRDGTNMPWDRKLSNGLSSLLLSLVTGVKLDDAQCGYRMIRIDSSKGIICKTDKYEYETELLLKMIRMKRRVGWINIPTRYYGEFSSIRRFSDTLRFLRIVWLYLIRAL